MSTPTSQAAASDAPIACTLTPGQYASCAAELSALARRALRFRQQTPHGERLAFEGGEQVERELRAAVAAEAACCAFLTMTVTRADGRLVLDVGGPPEARPMIAELFA